MAAHASASTSRDAANVSANVTDDLELQYFKPIGKLEVNFAELRNG